MLASMSKAFTRENDSAPEANGASDDEAELVAAARPAYITREGWSRLQEELEQLWRVERPRVTHEVMVAAAQGDRSENAEYIYGKKRLREIDRRVRFLRKRLDVLTVVEPQKAQEGKAYFGAWVDVEDEEGNASTYRIVGVDEHDVTRGYISIASPVAKALLGKPEGAEVTVVRPKGPTTLVITAIRYPVGP